MPPSFSSMVSICCCSLLLVVLVPSTTLAKGLNIVVNGHDSECLFLTEKKESNLDFLVLSGGSKIDFHMYKPEQTTPVIKKHRVEEVVQYKLLLNVTGDYKFCFFNLYQRHSINVAFEYDMFNEQDKNEELTELQMDVRGLYDNIQNEIMGLVSEDGFAEKHDVVQNFHLTNLIKKHKEDTYSVRSTDEKLKGSMAWISLNLERIEQQMLIHHQRLGRHYFLQLLNQDRVMQYSVLISLAMIVSTCVQLVVVKGFFNGTRSWNVFSYK